MTYNRMEAKLIAGEPCRFCGDATAPLVKTLCCDQWIWASSTASATLKTLDPMQRFAYSATLTRLSNRHTAHTAHDEPDRAAL